MLDSAGFKHLPPGYTRYNYFEFDIINDQVIVTIRKLCTTSRDDKSNMQVVLVENVEKTRTAIINVVFGGHALTRENVCLPVSVPRQLELNKLAAILKKLDFIPKEYRKFYPSPRMDQHELFDSRILQNRFAYIKQLYPIIKCSSP